MTKKKFPKIIIFAGMMGVGKTYLTFKVMNVLKNYNFQQTSENLINNKFKDYSNLKNPLFGPFKNDLERLQLIHLFLKYREDHLLFDGFPMNTIFVKSITSPNSLNSILHGVYDNILKYIKQFNLNKDDLKNILLLHITNEKGYEQYERRGQTFIKNEKEYDIVKENYNRVIEFLFLENNPTGINYKKIDITNLDLNSEDKIRKFIEKNFLVEKEEELCS